MTVWSAFTNDFSFLPKDLSVDELATAKAEIRSMPDVFYTTLQLPVITPDSAKEWLTKLKAANVGPPSAERTTPAAT